MTDLVFVYGSLKKDYWNHRVLGSSPFVREDCVGDAELYRPYPEFPVMFEGNGIVHGEVYRITDTSTWRFLDYLEGEGVMYNRISTQTQSGLMVQSYVGCIPFWDKETMVKIENGIWSRHNG